MTRTVPFLDLGPGRDAIRAELDGAWSAVVDHGAFVGGPEVAEFESRFAQLCGTRRCVGVANGTDALELTLRALGIGRGAEVIVPTNTFVATAEAVANIGAVPRFVDVDPETLLVGVDDVRAALGPRTEAIIAVHLYGQPCDLDELGVLASAHGLAFVQDAAQAHGATYRGAPVGSHGHAATFSFYPGKNLGAFGDGGAVVTEDDALADAIAQLAAHGRDADDRQVHQVVGRNSRLDTLQAAVLSARLDRLEDENAHRRRVRAWYDLHLPASIRPITQVDDRLSSHHLMVVEVSDREATMHQLTAAGVGTGIHYRVPCHLQPAFADPDAPGLPVAEAAATRILSLPMGPHLEESDVVYVCEQLSAGVVESAA